MNWKALGRKWSWSYDPDICMQGVRKTTKNSKSRQPVSQPKFKPSTSQMRQECYCYTNMLNSVAVCSFRNKILKLSQLLAALNTTSKYWLKCSLSLNPTTKHPSLYSQQYRHRPLVSVPGRFHEWTHL